MKTCCRCGQTKSLTEFHKRAARRDGLQSYCKECAKSHYKSWQQQSPERRARMAGWKKERVTRHRLKYLAILVQSNGCVDCGYKDNPAALVFDHVSGTKSGGVTALINRGAPWDQIEQEISKCELRCWNCHAIVTSQRGNWWTVTASL